MVSGADEKPPARVASAPETSEPNGDGIGSVGVPPGGAKDLSRQPTKLDEIVRALLGAALLLDEGLTLKNLELAMRETALALVWMRSLPGGDGVRERLVETVKAELLRRQAPSAEEKSSAEASR